MKMMIMVIECPSCEHENRDEANYCSKCGVKIFSPSTEVESETVTTEPPMTAEPEVHVGCSFHPQAMASHLCGRCGRTLCRSCVRFSSGIVFCPLCWAGPVQPRLSVQEQVTRPLYPLVMPQRYFG